jgi:hypothetical protein
VSLKSFWSEVAPDVDSGRVEQFCNSKRPQIGCLPLMRPRCGDATAPYDMITLHPKDIGEIGTDRDLQIEAY